MGDNVCGMFFGVYQGLTIGRRDATHNCGWSTKDVHLGLMLGTGCGLQSHSKSGSGRAVTCLILASLSSALWFLRSLICRSVRPCVLGSSPLIMSGWKTRICGKV